MERQRLLLPSDDSDSDKTVLTNEKVKSSGANLQDGTRLRIPALVDDQLSGRSKERWADDSALNIGKSPRLIKHQRRLSDFSPDLLVHQVETFAKHVWNTRWEVIPHNLLPKWMRDNEFLIGSHRPQLPSAAECFKSIFRMHTETINIWTHLVGALIFLVWFLHLLVTPSDAIPPQAKPVMALFFLGAISCLAGSTVFHTLSCHSHGVCKLFNKIDYCGISMLIMGSFCPWLYYAFHCRFTEKLVYILVMSVIGAVCIGVSLVDRFSEPSYRTIRAGVFILFGLSAVVPCCHHMIIFGVDHSFKYASIAWLIVMGCMYITGALLYASRIPERFFPGKFDIWGQSHQFFHVLVVAAAAVHYYGIMSLAMNHHLLCPLSERTKAPVG